MNFEPRREGDYSERQVAAAHRVLVDVGQILAAFHDAIVVVGDWVPDLLVRDAEPKHVGSIDVDLALDASKLSDGRYAELLGLLLDTSRYKIGDKAFQLVTEVDLSDGERPIRVEVEFLAPSDVKIQKNHPKLIDDFRAYSFPRAQQPLRCPLTRKLSGR